METFEILVLFFSFSFFRFGEGFLVSLHVGFWILVLVPVQLCGEQLILVPKRVSSCVCSLYMFFSFCVTSFYIKIMM